MEQNDLMNWVEQHLCYSLWKSRAINMCLTGFYAAPTKCSGGTNAYRYESDDNIGDPSAPQDADGGDPYSWSTKIFSEIGLACAAARALIVLIPLCLVLRWRWKSHPIPSEEIIMCHPMRQFKLSDATLLVHFSQHE